jgi:hypothetical protein
MPCVEYILYMEWSVIFDERFSAWLDAQEEDLQDEIAANLKVLQEDGPALGRPRVDRVRGSAFENLKELRVQYHGAPYRILFAFDFRRQAVLLVGGCKAGDKRWYKTNVPIADKRFKQHLEELRRESEK